MPKIVSTAHYEKRLTVFKRQHPEMRQRYIYTILLLESNPFHSSLRLQKLKGSLSDLFSVSLNMKYRIIIDFMIHENQVILIDIGDHDSMY